MNDKTLNEISPMRRLNLIMPPAVRRAQPVGKSDRQLANAKLLTIAVWNHWQFSLDWHSIHELFFRMFLTDDDVKPALERAAREQWIEKADDEPILQLRVTEQVFQIYDDSPQSQLTFSHGPHQDLAIEEIELNCAGLRSLFPQQLMYPAASQLKRTKLYSGHKLQFIFARAIGGFDYWSVQVNFTLAGRELGIDRTTARHGFVRLGEFCGIPFSPISGGMTLHFSSAMYFPFERDSFNNRIVAKFVGEQVGHVQSGDETGNLSPAVGVNTRHSSPGGDRSSHSSPRRIGEVVTDVPNHPHPRGRNSLSVTGSGDETGNPSPHAVRHVYEMKNEMIDMSWHQNSIDVEDVRQRVIDRMQRIYNAVNDLRGTEQYMLFCWAVLVETNLFQANGEAKQIEPDRFDSLIDDANRGKAPGAVLTTLVKIELASGNGKLRWKSEADRIAKLLNFTDNLRVKCAVKPKQTKPDRNAWVDEIYYATVIQLRRSNPDTSDDEIRQALETNGLTAEEISRCGIATASNGQTTNDDVK